MNTKKYSLIKYPINIFLIIFFDCIINDWSNDKVDIIVEIDKIVIKTPREPLSSIVKYLASIIDVKKPIIPIKILDK